MKKREYLMMLFEAEETQENNETQDTENETQEGEQAQKPAAKYTDADVDAMKIKWKAEWQKKQAAAVAEAEKLAHMNEQERAEHQAKEWERKYNELLARNTKAELTVEARRMLDDAHINGVPEKLVGMLVTEDADTTKANVESFATLFQEAVQNALKDLNRRPSPKTGGSTGITKDEIMKIKDVNERQRLIAEHMDLFRK